jgi:signal transduction histidine kinase
MAAFAVGALVLASGLSMLTYSLSRTYLLNQRQRSAVRQAQANGRLVQSLLRSSNPDIPRLLGSLETPASSRSIVFHDGDWFATSAATGPDALPQALRDMVIRDVTPARQRYRHTGTTMVAVGIPLESGDAYFEAFPLTELPRTLRVLAYSLLAGSVVTLLASLILGSWAARRVLRPVGEIGRAASAIAEGRLDARLDVQGDEELVQLAAGFNAMVDSLQTRIEREARFASDVGHELRSPLTTLRSAVDVMRGRERQLDPRSARALELLAEEVDRFEHLVQDLLEISRYDAGMAVVDFQPVDLNALVTGVIEEAGQTQARLDLAPADTIVLADRRRLEQAARNIVQNAVSHGGGVVRAATEIDEAHARIVVEDQGPGVSAEDEPVIFERFSRGRAAGRRSSGAGVGLGLALVSEHMRLQQGTVSFANTTPLGVRFVLELPRRS